MSAAWVVLLLAAAWLGFLFVEVIQLRRHREAIPLRIAVTGTRGKTHVTRLLASVLREDGRTVLAKSTGTEAAYILPDGSIRPIRRRGPPNVLEQKNLLKLGAELGAEVVVAEIMSLRPECHRVEARKILRPHLVLATNFRVDHLEAQGSTREAVADTLVLDVPSGGRVLVPEEEWEETFREGIEREGGLVVKVPEGEGLTLSGRDGASDFSENLDLVWAAARELGVPDESIRLGISRAQGDLGELRAWRYGKKAAGTDGAAAPEPGTVPWLVVNAFAANDPESTFRIHDRVMRWEGTPAGPSTGLLSLRADRGDRTSLWAEALAHGGLDRFDRLLVAGFHARALRHRLRKTPGVEKVEVLKAGRPEAVMQAVAAGARGIGAVGDTAAPQLLFGFGNMKGLGEGLVQHWAQEGEPHGI